MNNRPTSRELQAHAKRLLQEDRLGDIAILVENACQSGGYRILILTLNNLLEFCSDPSQARQISHFLDEYVTVSPFFTRLLRVKEEAMYARLGDVGKLKTLF